MPTSKSALKRVRQAERKRVANRMVKSSLRTAIKKFQTAEKAGDAKAAETAYAAVQKCADNTAAKKIVHKGTVARIKSRLSTRLNKLQKPK